MGIYDVDDYLARAKTYIEAGDEISLRHACLEMRLCLERIVYHKLGQIGEQLPPAVYRKWQPPQAMKMFLSFEPTADLDQSVTLTPSVGVPFYMGEYKMFSATWLKKNYNKLGNFLHATSLADANNPSKLTACDAQEIFNEIERVASGTMLMSINSIETIPCEACKGNMYASVSQIKAGAIVECMGCGNKHLVRCDDDKETYIIEPSNLFMFSCQKCNSPIPVEETNKNFEKACWKCSQMYYFGWGFKMALPTSNDEIASDH